MNQLRYVIPATLLIGGSGIFYGWMRNWSRVEPGMPANLAARSARDISASALSNVAIRASQRCRRGDGWQPCDDTPDKAFVARPPGR